MRSERLRQRGFTLLELLVVLVIAGMTLGLVSFNAMPSGRQTLQREAQRIALLLELARDEAIVRNTPIAFEVTGDRYQFLLRVDNTWHGLPNDELLRERTFEHPPIAVFFNTPAADKTHPLRVVFGLEPVDKPFSIVLSSGEVSVTIHADGVGHFAIE